jgi:hypothetical protein
MDSVCFLTEKRACVITTASHTTQIFQILYLTLSGVLKRRPRYQLPFENDHVIVKSTMKVYPDFKRTMVQSSVWGAFLALGVDFEMKREPDQLLFDERQPIEAQASGSCDPLTFPWTSYRADRVLLRSAGSVSRSKVA